jgi:hypothetical protein
MELENSLMDLQNHSIPLILSQIKINPQLYHIVLIYILILSSHLCLGPSFTFSNQHL